MTEREKVVETYLKHRALAYNVMAMKFVSPGTSGVPDQVLIGYTGDGNSRNIYVEVKRPDERPRPQQCKTIAAMREHGAIVTVVDHQEGIDELLDLAFGVQSRSTTNIPTTFYQNKEKEGNPTDIDISKVFTPTHQF